MADVKNSQLNARLFALGGSAAVPEELFTLAGELCGYLKPASLGQYEGQKPSISTWKNYDASKFYGSGWWSAPSFGYINGYFYLEQFRNAAHDLYKSSDGVNWTFIGSVKTMPMFNRVKYINGEYVTPWKTSQDLINWKEIKTYRSKNDDSDTNYDIYGGDISDFTYGNGKYVAVGSIKDIGEPHIQVSDNLYIWSIVDIKHIAKKFLEKVMFANDAFYAQGEDGIIKSIDGENWIKISSLNLRDFTFAKGMFWGISGKDLMKSKDGSNWSKVDSDLVFDDLRKDLIYGGGIFLVLDESSLDDITRIYTSTNGEKWTESFKLVVSTSKEGSMKVPSYGLTKPIYGNGVFLSRTSNSMFAGEDAEKAYQFYYAKVEDPIVEQTEEQVMNREKIGNIDTSNLVPLKDSLSLVMTPEIISRLQGYKYITNPKYDDYHKVYLDFDFMGNINSMEAYNIYEAFMDELYPFDDNETFYSKYSLVYEAERTTQYTIGQYVIRGLLRVKSKDGTITDQDVEYEFTKSLEYNGSVPTYRYKIIEARQLSDKKVISPK